MEPQARAAGPAEPEPGCSSPGSVADCGGSGLPPSQALPPKSRLVIGLARLALLSPMGWSGRMVWPGYKKIRPIRAHPERSGAAKLEVSSAGQDRGEIARCRRWTQASRQYAREPCRVWEAL
jgi:hypothetical protein